MNSYLPLNMWAECEKGQPMVCAETMTMTQIVTHELLPAPEYVSWVWEGAAHGLSRDHDQYILQPDLLLVNLDPGLATENVT